MLLYARARARRLKTGLNIIGTPPWLRGLAVHIVGVVQNKTLVLHRAYSTPTIALLSSSLACGTRLVMATSQDYLGSTKWVEKMKGSFTLLDRIELDISELLAILVKINIEHVYFNPHYHRC